ncbi:MAG: nucleoside triphosphate pyrophosphohydrolase, partial [Ktedonobacterales bacterium]
PWDREQTHQSLRRYVLEEAYEVAEVLDEWDGSPEVAEHLAEELGDLLLQVYLQAEVANQEDLFSIGDVFQGITEKLIRRHPHVFGDVQAPDAAHVVRNWEAIKRTERAAKDGAKGETAGEATPQAESALRGIPRSAPALYQAYELSRKAAKVGFDWPDDAGSVAKVAEEARELAEISADEDDSEARRAAELGDLLFAVASLGRRMGLHPEDALEAANKRFRRRFEAMEAQAQRDGATLATLTTDDWLHLWAQAKATTNA